MLIFFHFTWATVRVTTPNDETSKDTTTPSEKSEEALQNPIDFSLCENETNKAKCCKEKYAQNVKRCARTLRKKIQHGR
jgi:hypothetical protein